MNVQPRPIHIISKMPHFEFETVVKRMKWTALWIVLKCFKLPPSNWNRLILNIKHKTDINVLSLKWGILNPRQSGVLHTTNVQHETMKYKAVHPSHRIWKRGSIFSTRKSRVRNSSGSAKRKRQRWRGNLVCLFVHPIQTDLPSLEQRKEE